MLLVVFMLDSDYSPSSVTTNNINGLVRFAGRPKLLSARVPLHSVFTLQLNIYGTFIVATISCRGTRWRSWLRHCATNRKVAGSIPDVVIEIFRLHNPSGRTMALGLTQPLTEMSTR